MHDPQGRSQIRSQIRSGIGSSAPIDKTPGSLSPPVRTLGRHVSKPGERQSPPIRGAAFPDPFPRRGPGGPGYFAVDCAAWPLIADALTAAGTAWPEEAILTDLRWWADQERLGRATRPGRPSLQRRWHVGDTVARRLMRAEEQWACPIQAGRSARLAAEVAEAAARLAVPTSERPAVDQLATSRAQVQTAQCEAVDQRQASEQPATGPTRGVQSSEAETESDPPPTPSEAEGDALGSLGPMLEAELPGLPTQLLSGLAQGTEAALRDLRTELRRRRRWPADAPRLRGQLARVVAQRAGALLDTARRRDEAELARRSRERAIEAARSLADYAYLGVDPLPEEDLDAEVLASLVELLGEGAHAALCRAAVDARVEAAPPPPSVPDRPAPAVQAVRADPAWVRERVARHRAGAAA